MFSWPLGTTPYALTRAHSRYFVRTRSTLLLQWADNLGSALGHAVICTTYTTNKNIPCNTPPSPQRQFHARTYIYTRYGAGESSTERRPFYTGGVLCGFGEEYIGTATREDCNHLTGSRYQCPVGRRRGGGGARERAFCLGH